MVNNKGIVTFGAGHNAQPLTFDILLQGYRPVAHGDIVPSVEERVSTDKEGNKQTNYHFSGRFHEDKMYSFEGEPVPAIPGAYARNASLVFAPAIKPTGKGTGVHHYTFDDKQDEKGNPLALTTSQVIAAKEQGAIGRFGNVIGKLTDSDGHFQSISTTMAWRKPVNGDSLRLTTRDGQPLYRSIGKKLTQVSSNAARFPTDSPEEGGQPIAASGKYYEGLVIDTQTFNFLQRYGDKSLERVDTLSTAVIEKAPMDTKSEQALSFLQVRSGIDKNLSPAQRLQGNYAYSYLNSEISTNWERLREAGKTAGSSAGTGAVATALTTAAGIALDVGTGGAVTAGLVIGTIVTAGIQRSKRDELTKSYEQARPSEIKEREGTSITQHKIQFLGINEKTSQRDNLSSSRGMNNPLGRLIKAYAGKDYLDKGGEYAVHEEKKSARTKSVVSSAIATTAVVLSSLADSKGLMGTLGAGIAGFVTFKVVDKVSNAINFRSINASEKGLQALEDAKTFSSQPKMRNTPDKGDPSWHFPLRNFMKSVGTPLDTPPRNREDDRKR